MPNRDDYAPNTVQEIGFRYFLLLTLMCLFGCSGPFVPQPRTEAENHSTLAIMSLADEENGNFEDSVLRGFAEQQGFHFRYIPLLETVNDRLEMYQKLLRKQSPKPDLLEIDIIWPPTLAEYLMDLKPYLGEDVASFPPELIKTFTIDGRLVAIPLYLNTGLLYYRSDLLKKYGFAEPPKTWDQLEIMAKVIQQGERRIGRKDFWGYVWQGQAAEGLTCDALEWVSSEGGGAILGADKTVMVYNPISIRALERAVSWVGSISPPGVIAYNEDDALNVWRSGNAAFMRNWSSLYGSLQQPSSPVRGRFGVAMLPHGVPGPNRALGGIAVGISRYSDHPARALSLLRYLTGEKTQRRRAEELGGVPIRSSLQRQPELMDKTAFHGALSGQIMTDVIARPSVVAGKFYASVSQAYFEAVHSALTRQTTPDQALHRLESDLVKMTGFRAVHSAIPVK